MMGKSGGWIHSIKKAVHNHLVGDIDPNKFQHLPGPSKGTTPRTQSECSSSSSHTVDAQYQRSSVSARGSSHYEQEERRRYSTSSQVHYAESNTYRKSPTHDRASSSSGTSPFTMGSPSPWGCTNRDSERPRRDKDSGDHSHLVKLYREDRAGGTVSGNPINKDGKPRSRTSYDRKSTNGSGENWSAASEQDRSEERRRPSTSSQKERSPREKPHVDTGRLSNASQQNNERSVLEKGRSSTSPNYNSGKTAPIVDDNRSPSAPWLPDDRTKNLLTEIHSKSQQENRRPSTDKGRPKPPASPRKAVIIPPAPTSFDRKSSSSSTMSIAQAGGRARSITSEGSNMSEEFVDLVFPLPDANTPLTTTTRASPHHPQHQRRKGAAPIATMQEVFSSHEYEAPISPGSQRRKSGNFHSKSVVPLSEHGTKSLLPPDYRNPLAAVAVADLGVVMFHAGEAGVGGMLGEWAAVMIQSFWRGYAARMAVKRLRALVRLQALARGYLARKKFRPLVHARIQAARARNKLSRNSKVQLHPTSNGYGIAQTILQNQPHQYTFAQPVLENSLTPAARKSSKSRENSIPDVRDWNNPVKLITVAELKQEVLMKKEKTRQEQQQQQR
ncbi:hypothetical protein R1sor_018492 [Riccia sorocarpa]|uniref:DUF4005 domain-containing protein n=1 Tax=Riccia sorocarpa TaxID=122646 RepID=A0ABD3I9U7_9MARC